MSRVAREETRPLEGYQPEAQTAIGVLRPRGATRQKRQSHTAIESLPPNDRELSDEAVRAIHEGIADHEAGRTYTLEDVKRELGH